MTCWRRLVAFVGVVAFVTAAASGQCSALTSPRIYAYAVSVQHSSTTAGEHGVSGTAIRASLRADDASSDNPPGPASDFVAAETAGNAGDHIVLGLRANGLEATAAKVGGRTLLKDPEWMTTLQRGIADPSTKFTVSLDGMSGSSTYSQVMSAAGRGAAGTGGYTDWEMAQLYQGGRLSDTTFMRGGSVVDNPFG